MLAVPVSFARRLEQYVGRLNRDYEGKTFVVVNDYVDLHLPVFNNMFLKRLRTYRKIGFELLTGELSEKQVANAIFSSTNYYDVFEQDLIEAESEIVISSPDISHEKIERFVSIMKPRQEKEVKVTIITENPNNRAVGNPAYLLGLIHELRNIGISIGHADNVNEHYAVIDRALVWHGGMNLLGKADVWDNLIRVKDLQAASELMEMQFSIPRMEVTEFGQHKTAMIDDTSEDE